MTHRLKRLALGLAAAAVLAGAAGAAVLAAFEATVRDVVVADALPPGSPQVVDREGRLLRPFLDREGRWRIETAPADVDPRYLAALIAFEDKRFHAHNGVDPLAILRAGLSGVRHGRVVSGASTLSMQAARLASPGETTRTAAGKWRQAARAVALERRFGKEEVLRRYLTLAPFGGNVEGVRAAALMWLGREPRRLTPGEIAFLIALPQSPEARRPDRDAAALRRARDRVLTRMAAAGLITREEAVRAGTEPLPAERRPMPVHAAHLAEALVRAEPEKSLHLTTLDRTLQSSLEALAASAVNRIPPGTTLAIVAIDHATGEVTARIGGPDHLDKARAGAVDMALAVRSPGSALKPFIYALAFEDGIAHPETLIEDRPVRFSGYAPENFDAGFHGTVTTRRALQWSLNLPAVALLEAVGAQRLVARLNQAGVTLVLPRGEAAGLAIGLGGVGVRLLDLTAGYAGLARGGLALPVTHRPGDLSRPPRRLVDAVAAWYIADILRAAPAPENAATGRIAFKTGTSYGYRDAWAIGFDGRRTIGVWVGRPDNGAVPGLVGRRVAAPILFDAFARTGAEPRPLPGPPQGVLMASTPRLPPPLQRFGAAPLGSAISREPPVAIAFPPPGARLALEEGPDQRPEPLAIRVAGGVPPFALLVDGAPVGPPTARRLVEWQPKGPGFVRLTVLDASGAASSIEVRFE